MSRKEEERRASSGTIIKVLVLMYIVVFEIGFVKEYVFTRADSTSHIIGIVVGVILLAIGIPLLISTIKGIGASRRYYQKNSRVKPVDYTKTNPYMYGRRDVSKKKNGRSGK